MKKIAVITDAVSPEFFFPLWYRYYGGLFGAENLHVVTYKGLKPAFSGITLGNLWGVDAAYDDGLRTEIIADLISALLRQYDVVIRCDIDEFLVPDPQHFADFADFVQRNELPYVTAMGIDVVELPEDAPLDLALPIFGVQRHYGILSTALNKTCVTTVALRWAAGFHGASAPPCFAGLYLLHLKFADLRGRVAWDRVVLEGLVPGSSEHAYFAVGAEHLTGELKSLVAKPRSGAETEAAFTARFLQTMRHDPVTSIHQGAFFRQDFLIPLDRFAPPKSLGDVLRAYQGTSLAAPPAQNGKILEAPEFWPRPAPVEDIAGQGLNFPMPEGLHIHGSYLLEQRDALLFGPNTLVDTAGAWSCAARQNAGMFFELYTSPGFAGRFPGPKPGFASGLALDVSMLREDDVQIINEPVYLATLLRPADWNLWVTAMPGKIAQFRRHGAGRKFLCHVSFAWQRAFLRLAGVPDAAILPHDPGRTYLCRDVMTVEYSDVNMTISAHERADIFELVATRRARKTYPQKLFVGGATPELASALGFTLVEPQSLDLAEQIGMFAAAEQIVFHGPAAVGNAVFCQPGASVVTIGTTAAEARLLASLGLRHGGLLHAANAVPAIEAFFK